MSATYLDPDGTHHGIPTWPYRCAPDDLYTHDQLAEMGLRPTADPVAQVMWRPAPRHRQPGQTERTAALYRLVDTLMRDAPSEALLAHLELARACRRICQTCGQMRGYVIPAGAGMCLDCQDQAARGGSTRPTCSIVF
ncbi:RRQRL motif-containing zinc-binding protein [Frankia gtarii]|uniref:RRQRL motif-containing zinc-binding protein n=1 Tax=Frankia gtarii TaxID=2950102 RepID=UPI0021BFCE0F|nr:RRQRL motif-containing zinc-binding protein [Frankia gtarii]